MRLSGTALGCVRGGRRVFEGIDFALADGDLMTVTGRNGAGKSSLLRLVAGLIEPSEGRLDLDGGDPERGIGEHCHYAGHADALKPSLTARETLDFWRAVMGEPWLEAEEALDRLSIGHLADLPSGYFSAGQKRRLALARLFVTRRPIWLLDEPTSALDAATQALFAAAMREHCEGGGMILAATHADLGLKPTMTLPIA